MYSPAKYQNQNDPSDEKLNIKTKVRHKGQEKVNSIIAKCTIKNIIKN